MNLQTNYKILNLLNNHEILEAKRTLEKLIHDEEILKSKGKNALNEKKLIEKYLKRIDKNKKHMIGIHICNDIKFVVNGYNLIQITDDYNMQHVDKSMNFNSLTDSVFDGIVIPIDKDKLTEVKTKCKLAKNEKLFVKIKNKVLDPVLLLELLEFYVNGIEFYIDEIKINPVGILGDNRKSMILPINYATIEDHLKYEIEL